MLGESDERVCYGENEEIKMQGMSVVIPTYNRGALLEETLLLCQKYANGLNIEFIVIDDGSKDDTAERLKRLSSSISNLKWKTVPNKGPGQARNLATEMTRHEIVLFIGDDVQPLDDNFFRCHLEVHEKYTEENIGVLGKVVWPSHHKDNVNFIMNHIQGLGGEQFGYHHLIPFSWLDWRFFYTSNVSIKKSIVSDWKKNGFSAEFSLAAFEDIEFAYRLAKRPKGFSCLYIPASVGRHCHEYSMENFINRQISAGLMANVFLRLHPNVKVELDISHLVDALQKPLEKDALKSLPDYLSMIEGIKSWAMVINRIQKLGSQNWHDDFLTAVFQLTYGQGFLMGYSEPLANFPLAYQVALDRFLLRMKRSIHIEALGNMASRINFFKVPIVAIIRFQKFKEWVGKKPLLVTIYNALIRFISIFHRKEQR